MSQNNSVSLGSIVDRFHLEVLRGPEGYQDRKIYTADVNRPGLQLTGFFDYFDARRLMSRWPRLTSSMAVSLLPTPDSPRMSTPSP